MATISIPTHGKKFVIQVDGDYIHIIPCDGNGEASVQSGLLGSACVLDSGESCESFSSVGFSEYHYSPETDPMVNGEWDPSPVVNNNPVYDPRQDPMVNGEWDSEIVNNYYAFDYLQSAQFWMEQHSVRVSEKVNMYMDISDTLEIACNEFMEWFRENSTIMNSKSAL